MPVTPLMRRVVLAVDAADYASGGLHVRVLITPGADWACTARPAIATYGWFDHAGVDLAE